MPAPNEITARAREVRILIGEDRVPDAIKRLMDFVTDYADDAAMDQAIQISASFHSLAKKERKNELPYSEVEQARRRLFWEMFELLDDVRGRATLPKAS